MRPLRLVPLALLCAIGCGALGCQPAQHHVLLRVHSLADVANVQVVVLALDTGRRHEERIRRVDLSAAQIAEQPIHMTVDLTRAESATVLIHIHATTPAGEHLYATRCYPVSGTVVDDLLLFGPLGALDIDGDGFITEPASVCRELGPEGTEVGCDGDLYVCEDRQASDCSEGNSSIHPGARTICLDAIDQDCDGMDEPCGDFDGDTFPACAETMTEGCDCDDGLATINPGATDTCNDGIDQDCSGADACCDSDQDGIEQCLDGYPDCNDEDDAIPAALEVCNGFDDNCNRLVDELDECRGPDIDGDGVAACGQEEPGDPCDCNDCDPGINQSARELCGNTVDENCDGMLDVGCLANDADGDGADADHDCNDADALFFPPSAGREAIDRCDDGMSNNCIPGEDTSCADDLDGDGYVEPAACEGNPLVRPGAGEVCNGVDDDCDSRIDEGLSSGPETGCANGAPIAFPIDFTHCGSCRRACDPLRNDVCVGSGCQCAATGAECADPASRCCGGAGCVDLLSNREHCGECNNPCGPMEMCMGGQCTCGTATGPAGIDACADAVAGSDQHACCGGTDCRQTLGTDTLNCGGCGIDCGASETCAAGACVCGPNVGGVGAGDVCTGATSTCCPAAGCVDTMNDEAHCGACGDPCATGEDCSVGVCRPVCGNGIITAGETCDDRDAIGGDGCSASCQIETGWQCTGAVSTCSAICGDGIIIPTLEVCDDADTGNGDGCSSTCRVETGWSCVGAGPSSCTTICGDGIVAGAEACDDSRTTACGPCNATCTALGTASVCGDTVVCPDTETCDDGRATACGPCNASCTGPGTGSACGDSVVCPDTEACDDGRMTACGPCNATCTGAGTVAVCGDNAVCPDSETCDDGRVTPCGPCNATCTGPGTGSVCGDSTVCPDTEACDDGRMTACGPCNATCTGTGTAAVCGDGMVCPDSEMCDDGAATACGPCNATCSGMGSGSCGDGFRCPGIEQCDDGNVAGGDGCTSTCTIAPGWTCTVGSPDTCAPICGDGSRVGSEVCDDYNANACGLCNASCSDTIPTGMRVLCPNGVGCETNADCMSGNCAAGHVCRAP